MVKSLVLPRLKKAFKESLSIPIKFSGRFVNQLNAHLKRATIQALLIVCNCASVPNKKISFLVAEKFAPQFGVKIWIDGNNAY